MTKPIKTCWIHIGMHKTGTTSLQQTLSRLDDLPGWAYLCLGRYANLGVPLHAMFATEPMRYHWFGKAGHTKSAVAKLGERWRSEVLSFINERKPDNLLISAEGITLIDEAGIARMKVFLEPLADDIRIVGVARPPVAYASSIFQQHLKHGMGRFNLDKIAPRYRQRFEKFDRVFGVDKVMLWKFDPAKFAKGCAVTDFCQRLGIPITDNTPIVRSNESLSSPACSMLYAYRKFGPGYGKGPLVVKENRSLINALMSVKGPKFKLDAGVVGEALKDHADDIRWMEERLGESLQESTDQGGGATASEDDLLRLPADATTLFSTAFFETTLVHVEPKAAASDHESPQAMADFMQACRDAFRINILGPGGDAVSESNQKANNAMKLIDVIEAVKQSEQEALGKMSSKNALLLVRKVLQQIAHQIESAPDGEVIKVPVLGSFHGKTVTVQKDGANVARRRVTFKKADTASVKKAAGRKVAKAKAAA